MMKNFIFGRTIPLRLWEKSLESITLLCVHGYVWPWLWSLMIMNLLLPSDLAQVEYSKLEKRIIEQ